MMFDQTKQKEAPVADDKKEVVLIPTYGYHGDTGAPKLFQLKEGEKLPTGWVDNPALSKKGKEDAKKAEAEGLA